MKMKEQKTNVMRILDKSKIAYKSHDYSHTGVISGTEVAAALGQNPKQVFKTLVTEGKSGNHYVFVIPVEDELDLKKAAKSVGEKYVEMIKQKDMLKITGYIHGGCSPIGMKKPFTTVINNTAAEYATIIFSAGKIGHQVELGIDRLRKVIDFDLVDVVKNMH
ncbi:MAG: Cys-tRNA(Pro) deacylase [Clostridiales bacterium]|nr:Cys-tRNA(Pro) deacylase [Clostridiales bacterium]